MLEIVKNTNKKYCYHRQKKSNSIFAETKKCIRYTKDKEGIIYPLNFQKPLWI